MINDLSSLIVKPDRPDNDVIYSGADMKIDEFTRYLEILEIDPTCLFSH